MGAGFGGLNFVVTGGTGALGSAVVSRLLDGDGRVAIPCFQESELARFPFKGDPRVRISMGVDLANEGAVQRFFGDAGGTGAIWASIHIAGGFDMGPIEKTSGESFLKLMNQNATTCFFCCREAVKVMRAARTEGRIVNVAARPGLLPELGAGMVAYTASKAAVASITQSLAAEVASAGILVNAVVPSIMDTPANRKSMPEADHAKWPKVEEVAATIAFLASPENRVTRGALVPVYGRG